jgi:hypothetical protein
MARIATSEIERLKNEISEERLVESSGIVLWKSGNDRIRRPLPRRRHGVPGAYLGEEPVAMRRPSFGGGTIDWVMSAQGVSFRHALELSPRFSCSPGTASARRVDTPAAAR